MRSGPSSAGRRSGGPRHTRAARHDRGDRPAAAGGRWRRTTLTAVGLVLALVGALTLSAKAISPPPPEPATAPALLGAGAPADSGTAAAQQAATRRLETAIGRQFNIGHSFVPWGAALGEVPAANVAAGRTPMISFGRGGSWRGVAAGRDDRYLTALARSVAALGRPVLLRYAWGMDSGNLWTTRSRGAAYVAAWRHVHDLFAAQGVRAFWVWSPNADAFAGARGGVDQYWPGDDYVDWVAADGFNVGSCADRSTWRDFGPIFKAFYSWGSARAKPLMISGTGTVEDPIDPGRKRAWYLDAAGGLGRSMPRVRAVVLLDQGGRCDLRPDTSALSMRGFVDFARDPFFTGAAPTPTPPPPTTRPPTSTLPATSTTVTPTTKAPTTTAPTTTTPPSVPASTCSTSGGVAIGTGDDAQRVVDAHGAGTRYTVKAGTHLRNFSVRPKSGDTFCGEPGAVLDGGRSLRSAFSGGATDVTLDSVTVQQYATGRQGGAIHPDKAASGWVVRNVSAVRNYWAGLMAADNMKILGGRYSDNDQLGIGGNAATGVVLDGLDGDPATFDGPELARNHTLHESCDWEAGGMKWDVGRVTIRNAYVHDNDCRGLWADINARGALIEHNLIEDNREEGIFYEISQDAVIRNNRVYNNGLGGRGWYWAGGITVASSFNVEVYGNRLSGNFNGITGTQQDRTDSTPPAHLLDDYNVHDNLICATDGGRATGVIADNGDNLTARDITFTRNTTQSATCETA